MGERNLRLVGLFAIGFILAALNGVSYAGGWANDANDLDQDALFRAVGSRYGLDPGLLKAVAVVESAGKSQAVSRAGAAGLMQLMPVTAQRFRVTDPFDPVDNVLGAARFLTYLRGQGLSSQGETNLADLLAAYNAGEGAVRRYKGVPPYAQTRSYVRRVLWVYLFTDEPAETAKLQQEAAVETPAKSSSSAGPYAQEIAGRRHGTNRSEDETLLRQLAELRCQRARAATTQNSSRTGAGLAP
jgi:hypothetical protein